MAKSSIRTDKVVEELKVIRQMLSTKCAKKEGEGDEEQVITCSRADGVYCSVYAFPEAKWRSGDCPMADSELKTVVEVETKGKVRVGQQKQKKRR